MDDNISSNMSAALDSESELDTFLKKFIEEYLFKDMESIEKYVSSSLHPGAVGYPMIMSVCSGIELLGTLLSGVEDETYEEKNSPGYFGHYWKHYLGEVDQEYKKYTEIARVLIRNGIDHVFATKHRIGVTRSRPELHLRFLGDVLIICPDRLFDDFKKSYFELAKPKMMIGGAKRGQAINRISKLMEIYSEESERAFKAAKLSIEDTVTLAAYTPSMEQIVDENSFVAPSGMITDDNEGEGKDEMQPPSGVS